MMMGRLVDRRTSGWRRRFGLMLIMLQLALPVPMTKAASASDEWVDENRSPLDFVPGAAIIGVQKGGTTDLARLLGLHPEVALPWSESHYFDHCDFNSTSTLENCSLPTYGKLMKELLRDSINRDSFIVKAIADVKLVMEKSPSYIFFADSVAERIKRIVPNMKLIILLRGTR